MKIDYNSPVVLTFALASTLILMVNQLTNNAFVSLFSVGPGMDPFYVIDYFRLFSHVLGHGNWAHLAGNFTMILLLGPILEEKYGSRSLFNMMLLTAFITGLLNILFFNHGLLGASGIVFMMILLSSVVNLKQGHIPLTFILVVLIFLGQEIVNAFQQDNISQFAHIAGGGCGAAFGFMNGTKRRARA
jgi:membrane associated rhomboid family serine protease